MGVEFDADSRDLSVVGIVQKSWATKDYLTVKHEIDDH
jgi:hypothetical protein